MKRDLLSCRIHLRCLLGLLGQGSRGRLLLRCVAGSIGDAGCILLGALRERAGNHGTGQGKRRALVRKSGSLLGHGLPTSAATSGSAVSFVIHPSCSSITRLPYAAFTSECVT